MPGKCSATLRDCANRWLPLRRRSGAQWAFRQLPSKRWQNPDANRWPEGISMDHEVEAFELLVGCQANNQRAGSVRYAGIERRGWRNSHTGTCTAPVEPVRAGGGIQSKHVFSRCLGIEHEVTVLVGLGCLVRRVV